MMVLHRAAAPLGFLDRSPSDGLWLARMRQRQTPVFGTVTVGQSELPRPWAESSLFRSKARNFQSAMPPSSMGNTASMPVEACAWPLSRAGIGLSQDREADHGRHSG